MQEGASVLENVSDYPSAAARTGISLLWPALAGISIALLVGAVAARLIVGSRMDGLLVFAAGTAVVVILMRLFAGERAEAAPVAALPIDPHKALFESAGAAILAIDLEGKIIFVNPTAERMLGYHADQLKSGWSSFDLFGPGEASRLVTEMDKLRGVERGPLSRAARLAAYMEGVRSLPPSHIPAFDTQFRHRDGELLPVSLHTSALRDERGSITGMVVVAIDQSATSRQDQAQRESQERYRDLFENSTEMIATLSPTGKLLYANPALKRSFAKEDSDVAELGQFEDLFSLDCRQEVNALFRRALDGEHVDRSPLHHHTPDGRVMELELSLSQRQRAGNPLAVRCLIRDVTQQKQREHRLALQLVVSQIVGEHASPDVATVRILEALCVSQGWDMAVQWNVNADGSRLEFAAAWAAPGRRAETFIQESMGLHLGRGTDLPGTAWKEGRTVWITDLANEPHSPRIDTALNREMASGWAVPVREGNRVLAVLEFYCHYRLREEREAVAAVETVALSLGQMLARSAERGRAEELSRQQEILLDSVADGICGVDRHGLITFANPAAARLLGADSDSLRGMPVHEVLHGSAPRSRRCGEDCPLRRVYGRQKAASGEDAIFRADGTFFPAEYALTPIAEQGNFSGSVLSFHDISQRYALDRLKDEFISTVSHELRTPLTSIRGALGLLSSGMIGQVNEKSSNLLRIALNNSDRLVRLINDILDLERIQSGKEPLAFRPVQLAQIIRQAFDGMAHMADSAGVQLIHDTTQVEIAGDSDRLLQVLTNLVSNAVKFSPPNSTISVMLRPGSTGVTLSVIDQGRGIPADKLETIFGRFQQVDASDSRQKGGSGLGLAICRSIVEQHSGRIWAERNPVRGSTFRVFLPYKPAPVEGGRTNLDQEVGYGTVLLADAHPASRPYVSNLLSGHNYRVVEATSTEETLAAAHDGVEVILIDTAPDGLNGWEILPLLRRLRPEARTPIVLFSVDKRLEAEAVNEEKEVWVGSRQADDALLAELARVLCVPGENARVLVVESTPAIAQAISTVFARKAIDVHVAQNMQDALDACFNFQPHLLILDVGLPDGDSFNVVDWLRKHDSLSQLPVIAYSARDLSAEGSAPVNLGLTQLLANARLRPEELEALVLTILRSPREAEESTAAHGTLQNL